MNKIFAITSGKGGTGKSTVSVGLSLGFVSLGKKVLLIDMDEGLRCLDLMLGIDAQVVFDLSDVLSGINLNDAVYSVPNNELLQLIPAPRKLGSIENDALKNFLDIVRSNYDVIVLDFPAGIDFKLYSALPKDTQFITVCTPDPVSVRDAAIVCDNLPKTNFEPLLILNRFVFDIIKNGIFKNIDDIIDESGFRLLGIVPYEIDLQLLSVYHKLKKRGRSIKAFKRIVTRLSDKVAPLPKFKKI